MDRSSVVAFDFESCLIQPGLLAPPPVVLGIAYHDGIDVVPSEDGWRHMRSAVAKMLRAPRIVGFNVAFDMGLILQWFPELIAAVFAAYDQGRVLDAGIAERLGQIATGQPDQHYNLEKLAARYGIEIVKAGTPRKAYAPLLGEPLSAYPASAIEYIRIDADTHRRVWFRVRDRYPRVSDEAIADETRAALSLHLIAAWGLRTRPESVEALRQAAHDAVRQLRSGAREAGFLRWGGLAWQRDTKAIKKAVFEAWEGSPPITAAGAKLLRSRGRCALLTPDERFKFCASHKIALLDSGDPALEAFGHYGEWSAVLSKDIDLLMGGTRAPIHTRFGIAGTTRSTSSAPNTQNFRRLAGVRECIVPRPGMCFVEADVTGLELGTLAQVIAWKLEIDHMAKLISGGTDLHLLAAARLNSWAYEDARRWLKERTSEGLPTERSKEVKSARQFCKIANFGYAGMMGAESLVPYARAQGTRITLAQAVDLRANWESTLPSAAAYLRWIRSRKNKATGLYDFIIPGSDILRTGVTAASCANGHFQGLGARALKRILWLLSLDAWTERDSPLYGVPANMFVHDSITYETAIGNQHRVAQRVETIMQRGLRELLPDVTLGIETVASLYYSKDHEPSRDARGHLLISGHAA